ncbi:MAG TPA: hypothetical protein VNI01_09455, partial [Elusimicrobiota bacterium]|nr:hypothetical protein [Elusimicrobiota bacterium]
AFGKQWERTRGATARNAAGLDPGLAAGLQALGESLAADSNGGELGLTPGGADRVLGFLDCAQGGTTPEMRRLLQMLAADGGNLTDPTMKELKGAARAADANGLDLGMDPKLQRWMLDPGTDPASPQPAYPAMN